MDFVKIVNSCKTSLRVVKNMSERNGFRRPYGKVVNPCWTSFSTQSEVHFYVSNLCV